MNRLTRLIDEARDLRRAGDLPGALAGFEQALRIDATSARAHAGYALTLVKAGRIDDAISSYRESLRLRADHAYTWSALGDAYLAAGEVLLGIEVLRRACDLGAGSNAHSRLLYALNLDPAATPEAVYTEHRNWGRRYADVACPATHGNVASPDRILKIGYISGLLCRSTTYSFFSSILSAHDPERVQVTCYDNTPEPDDFTAALARSGAAWHRIHGMPDSTAEALIRGHAIDILVDLSGHTDGNRLTLFALQPAPVQVTYLGYPNTTGVPAIGYRLTDAVADPPGGTDCFYTEELVRLPRCFVAYTPFADAPPVAASPAARERHITFGSFSNLMKCNDGVLEAWAAILTRIPHSRLILHHGAAAAKSPAVYDAARSRVLPRFRAKGIDPGRIRLIGFLDPAAHFALYDEVDIALDPFPYNGTTTICEGLWMGVPVVALSGRTHAARVAASLLSAVDLERFAVSTVEEYIDLAVSLAGSPSALEVLRSTLRPRMARSPLTDGKSLARAIEDAYRRIWQQWCAERARRFSRTE